jgi:hypothetical protein
MRKVLTWISTALVCLALFCAIVGRLTVDAGSYYLVSLVEEKLDDVRPATAQLQGRPVIERRNGGIDVFLIYNVRGAGGRDLGRMRYRAIHFGLF